MVEDFDKVITIYKERLKGLTEDYDKIMRHYKKGDSTDALQWLCDEINRLSYIIDYLEADKPKQRPNRHTKFTF